MPVDPNVQNPGTQDDGQNVGDENQPFLVVDDRTRYLTQEEAVNGYQEAGRRIAELTPWQQTAADYGVRDPQEIAALLDELVELRAARNSRGAPNAAPNDSPNARPNTNTGDNGESANVDPKQKSALEWLSKNGEAAGLVSKQQLDAINTKLEALDNARAEVDSERFEMRIESGRSLLETELKGIGVLPADAAARKSFLGLMENALTTWVNADDRRVNQFYGSKEDLNALIQDGIKELMPVLNILKNQPAAAAAASRANAQPRTRQANAPATRTNANPNVKPTGKPNTRDTGEDFTPDVHERAFEALQGVLAKR